MEEGRELERGERTGWKAAGRHTAVVRSFRTVRAERLHAISRGVV